jgi:hypothetical protein
MVQVRQVLHRPSGSNETVRNNPKHEFWVQLSGLGVFIAKFSDVTSFSELVMKWYQFSKFCINYRAVTKRSEMPQNMSFGSNGVDELRSLQKLQTQLCLANLCINGPTSASFASSFVQ